MSRRAPNESNFVARMSFQLCRTELAAARRAQAECNTASDCYGARVAGWVKRGIVTENVAILLDML